MENQQEAERTKLRHELTEQERQQVYKSVLESLLRKEIVKFIQSYAEYKDNFKFIYSCDYDDALGRIDDILRNVKLTLRERHYNIPYPYAMKNYARETLHEQIYYAIKRVFE